MDADRISSKLIDMGLEVYKYAYETNKSLIDLQQENDRLKREQRKLKLKHSMTKRQLLITKRILRRNEEKLKELGDRTKVSCLSYNVRNLQSGDTLNFSSDNLYDPITPNPPVIQDGVAQPPAIQNLISTASMRSIPQHQYGTEMVLNEKVKTLHQK